MHSWFWRKHFAGPGLIPSAETSRNPSVPEPTPGQARIRARRLAWLHHRRDSARWSWGLGVLVVRTGNGASSRLSVSRHRHVGSRRADRRSASGLPGGEGEVGARISGEDSDTLFLEHAMARDRLTNRSHSPRRGARRRCPRSKAARAPTTARRPAPSPHRRRRRRNGAAPAP